MDQDFYSQHGLYFHNQYPQAPSDCLQLLQSSPSITFLNHESAIIQLTNESGLRTSFKVFGSPYSPAHELWAFGYQPEKAAELWDQVPLDADIVVTHTPPRYHCDESKDRGAAGCEVLRKALWRVRPRLAICGHIHDSRGVERVLWDLTMPNVKYKEKNSTYWIDSSIGSKKQALVDLSSRGFEPIRNNGGDDAANDDGPSFGTPVRNTSFISSFRSKSTDWPPLTRPRYIQSTTLPLASPTEILDTPPQSYASSYDTGSSYWAAPSLPESNETMQSHEVPLLSGRSDLEALTHRMGRKETCIINAAIMASSHGNGRKQYNKPIVVDIDLPVRVDGGP